jgi:pantetheine-phosphate adenylyltransferase
VEYVRIEERKQMTLDAIKHLKNVSVDVYNNEFLIDYAQKNNANYIIRGLRNQIDFEYEKQMCNFNKQYNPSIETIFVMPPPEYIDISSSFIKSLVGFNGWQNIIQTKVPQSVYDKFILKYGDKNE